MRGNWPDNLEHVITFMPLICSSQMSSKIMVVNVVCHSFLCDQSYVISIYAKINLSLQLVCNHSNYSVLKVVYLIIW